MLALALVLARSEPANDALLVPHPTFAVAHGASFSIASDAEVPLEDLLELAEDTRSRMRAWLEIDDDRASRTQIFLCRDVCAVEAIESAHRVPEDERWSPGTPFRGRYHASSDLIVAPYVTFEHSRWLVCHEVAHTVFASLVGRRIAVVDEGLAELVPHWIQSSCEASPERARARAPRYEAILADLVLRKQVPTFGELVSADPERFYASSFHDRNYALAWAFVRVLVESEDPRVAGRFPRFLRQLAHGDALFPTLRALYESEDVEAAWRASIERESPWKPLSGHWSFADGAVVGLSSSGTTALCVAREALAADRGFALSADVANDGERGLGYGFVVALRSADDFTTITLQPRLHSVQLVTHVRGELTRVHDLPFDPAGLAPDARRRRVRLEVRADGAFDFVVDGASLASGASNSHTGGAAGLVVEAIALKRVTARFAGARLER